MLDQALAARLDAAWGDPATWVAEGLQWTHLEAVRAEVARRVSGDPAVDPLHWFFRHAARAHALPLGRVLVLGCGTGRVERAILAEGLAREIVAVDLSARALEEARRQAGAAAGLTYLQADMNALPVGAPPLAAGSFDAVIGVASIHHCERLEALYEAVHTLLVSGGWLFLDEYIGPDRFQYADAHMRLAESVASLLPDALLTTASGRVRRGFRAPTVDEVVTLDPTEAVCASRILPALAPRFAIERHRPYAGALLHVLLAGVAQNFTQDHQGVLRTLIAIENEATRLGALEPHFACVIARRASG
jgi:SAM-dependent methyltransferase